MKQDQTEEYWVFAYGSLIWNPGFPWQVRLPARVFGYHRAFCIYSWHYRGTPEDPGLVLGLDKGGSCQGVAYQVRQRDWADTVAYLDAREMVTSVYRPVDVTIHMAHGKRTARTYTVDRAHEQYAGVLPLPEQADIIRHARGLGGPNDDYLRNTLDHLDEMKIRDRRLAALGKLFI